MRDPRFRAIYPATVRVQVGTSNLHVIAIETPTPCPPDSRLQILCSFFHGGSEPCGRCNFGVWIAPTCKAPSRWRPTFSVLTVPFDDLVNMGRQKDYVAN